MGSVMGGAIFVLSLLILENGVARVASAAHISDGSIMNSLLLWRGGMAIIADHFFRAWIRLWDWRRIRPLIQAAVAGRNLQLSSE